MGKYAQEHGNRNSETNGEFPGKSDNCTQEDGQEHACRGEGVTGLTRAVMYAGSPAAVVSLWSVSDEGTRELMVLFYKNMVNEGMTKETALRSAKTKLIKASSHPFFWAAFVMYGE